MLYYQIEEIEEPTGLSYEAAKDQIRKDLVEELAMKMMEEQAQADHDAVTNAIASGKTFAEAVKELELKPVIRKEVTGTGRMGAVRREYEKASRVNPGKLSDLITDDNQAFGLPRSFFLFVDKREVYENPALDVAVDAQIDGQTRMNQQIALMNWFSRQNAEADLQVHVKTE